jgi:hypothetical protein
MICSQLDTDEVSVGNDDVNGASRIQLRFTREKVCSGTAERHNHGRVVALKTECFYAVEPSVASPVASPKVDGGSDSLLMPYA